MKIFYRRILLKMHTRIIFSKPLAYIKRICYNRISEILEKTKEKSL